MKMDLRLETLHTLDNGSVGAIVNAAIRSAVTDIEDRGEQDGKQRKVVITLLLDRLDNGIIAVGAEAKAVVPVYRSSSTLAKPRFEGRQPILQFQAGSPENPDQATMEFEEN